MSILSALPLEAESGPGWWPYIIGGTCLVIFLILMGALLAFGKGREHS